jgi:amidophosphoribosyltransferase
MSDEIHEECGLAVVRLRKPLSYYQEKYGTPLWGFYKLFLLMEKQQNRGQDGAGIGSVKLNMAPGAPYMFRERSVQTNSLDVIFNEQLSHLEELKKNGSIDVESAESTKNGFDFCAEMYLGHLRYGTSGGYNMGYCHPYFRKNNWPTKSLILAGNFTLTNTTKLNENLIQRGQHPIFDTDTQTILEEIGYHLDQEHDAQFEKLKQTNNHSGPEIASLISKGLNIGNILRNACEQWDGGYSIAGMIGNGDLFVFRDAHGIRPLSYYMDDEVIAFASERAPLMTVFDTQQGEVKEVTPGTGIIVKKNGEFTTESIQEPKESRRCSFERIYFSRGNDPDIYQERKAMGGALLPQLLDSCGGSFKNTVFSFIPNTAEIAYYGLVNQLQTFHRSRIKEDLLNLPQGKPLTQDILDELFAKHSTKIEKVALKDIKLRTFISQEKGRNQMASHVYDISYGSVTSKDNLVVLDDSIVRGTTLKRSIIKILSRLNPRKIVIGSTAPQIRYPDCYGIDMSQLEKFIAFQAVLSLLKEHGQEHLLRDVYEEAKALVANPDPEKLYNPVKKLYDLFSTQEISKRISELVSPEIEGWNGTVDIVFQTIENLHESFQEEKGYYGDWYFTGDYPTAGGYLVVNKAYINFFENNNARSY